MGCVLCEFNAYICRTKTNKKTEIMRFRTTVTVEDSSKLTTAQLTKEMNRKYVIKYADGFEQGLSWRTTDSANATLFNSYCDAMLSASKDKHEILQSY
jgi:hypothetical protein